MLQGVAFSESLFLFLSVLNFKYLVIFWGLIWNTIFKKIWSDLMIFRMFFLLITIPLLSGFSGIKSLPDFDRNQKNSEPITKASPEQIQQFIELEDEMLELLYQSKDLRLKVINYPPETEADVEGDLEAISRRFDELFSIQTRQSVLGLEKPLSFALKKQRFQEFPAEKRQAIEARALESIYDKRWINMIGNLHFNTAKGPSIILERFVESGEFAQSLGRLPVGSQVGKVTWNPTFQQYEFEDPAFARILSKIAMVGYSRQSDFITARNSLEEEYLRKLRTNSQSDNGASKFETFDLIQGIIANRLEGTLPGVNRLSRIQAGKMAHAFLYDLLLSTPQEDPRGGDIQRVFAQKKPLGHKLDLYCVGRLSIKGPEAEDVYDYFGINYMKLEFSRIKNDQVLKCGGKSYQMSIDSLRQLQFPEPLPFVLDEFRGQDPVKASVYISLIREVSGGMSKVVELFLRHRGFKVEEREMVDTLSALKEDFLNSHLVIPASHLLDINNFQMGTKRSMRLRLTKKIKHAITGERVPVEVYLYVPVKDSEPLRVPGVDIAKWMQDRRRLMEVPLFVMNASCNSAYNNYYWNSIYYLSILADIEDGIYDPHRLPRDFIYSLGSKTGFSTSTPAQVLQDFTFPIEFLESLSAGESVEQVIAKLRLPPKRDLFIETLDLAWTTSTWFSGIIRKRRPNANGTVVRDVPAGEQEEMFRLSGERSGTHYPNGFDPAFNHDEPDALTGRTQYLILTDESDPGRVLRF